MKIYQVKGFLANSYVVEEDERLFVVDVEIGGEKYVITYIREVLGRDLSHVELVISTHDDRDHSGGIEALARECAASVGVPYASHSLMKKLWHNPLGVYYRPVTALNESLRPRMWRMYLNPYRRKRFRKTPRGMRHVPLQPLVGDVRPPDFYLRDHQPLPGFPDWAAIHTPGHSWDSCCYFHRASRSLIAGDTLLGSRKREKLLLPAIYANPKQMVKTISRLKNLNPANVYPGHGITFHGEGLLNHL